MSYNNLETEQTPFFAVSLPKLAIISFCTFGGYAYYWAYKNWCLIKAREQSSIYPIWRGWIFGPYFSYVCFARMRKYGEERQISGSPRMAVLAAALVICTLLVVLPDPYFLVSIFTFIFLLPVQAYVNKINRAVAPKHNPNSRFGIWNWVGVILGGSMVILSFAGIFITKYYPHYII
jgi:hypothetical protein